MSGSAKGCCRGRFQTCPYLPDQIKWSQTRSEPLEGPRWETMLTDSKLDSDKGVLNAKLEQVEQQLILDALRLTRGNQAKAAKILGITERIMGLRINKYQIDCNQFKTKM